MLAARRFRHSPGPLSFTAPTGRVLGAALLLGAAGGAPACVTPSVGIGAGGSGGAIASSSTGTGSVASTSGGGGVAITTSAAGAGGDQASTSSTTPWTSGGEFGSTTASSSASVGVTSSASTSSTTAGAGGSASSSASASSSSASSSSASSSAASSSSGAGGGASVIEPLDCTLSGLDGGDLVWTDNLAGPGAVWQSPDNPKGWQLDDVFTGSTGRVFVATTYFDFFMANQSHGGTALYELDGKGAYLGGSSISDTGGGFSARTSVFGARYHAFNAFIPHSMGVHDVRVESDAVSLAWEIFPSDIYAAIGFVTGNADGELFASFTGGMVMPFISSWLFPWGVEQGSFVVKWSSAGAHAFTRNLTQYTAFLAPGNSGDVFVGGTPSPGFDLGCGPIAGSGPYYVGRLDAAGQCLWSHAIVGVTSSVDHLAALPPAADGSVVVVDSGFNGTLDIGCGPMTSAPTGSSFAAKLDASGTCVWSKSFDVLKLLPSLFPSGDLLLSAPFAGTIDLGGGPLSSVGTQDVAVARLDGSSGAHMWSKSFGNAGVSLCTGFVPRCNAVADANGSVLLSGALTGWVDFGGGPLGSMAAQTYAVKLDGGGAFLWHHQWPDHTFVKADPCGAVVGAHDAGAYITLDKLAP